MTPCQSSPYWQRHPNFMGALEGELYRRGLLPWGQGVQLLFPCICQSQVSLGGGGRGISRKGSSHEVSRILQREVQVWAVSSSKEWVHLPDKWGSEWDTVALGIGHPLYLPGPLVPHFKLTPSPHNFSRILTGQKLGLVGQSTVPLWFVLRP